MKKIIISLLFLSVNTYATIDFNSSIYILSKDVNSEEYFVQKAPIIGCAGLAKGAELMGMVAEYSAPSNVGCGIISSVDINELSCATIDYSVETENYDGFKEVQLDISNCEDKNNPKFDAMVRKVVRMNLLSKTVRKVNVFLKK